MSTISVWLAGVSVVFLVGGFACWAIESCKNNWRNRITVEDLEELGRLFEQEGSFIGFNDRGEKFLVGFTKDK